MKFFNRPRKRHPVLASLFLLAVVSFIVWLAWDEEPLDYSEMAVELGPTDVSLNGYTFLSQILSENEAVCLEDFLPRSEVDLASMDVVVAETELVRFADLRIAVEQAVQMPVFQIDRSLSYDDNDPTVRAIHSYVEVMVVQARLYELSGKVDQSLSTLLQARRVSGLYAECGGGLLHYLTWCRSIRLIGEEIAGLLAVSEVEEHALEAAILSYSQSEPYVARAQVAFRQEFQYVMNALDRVSRGSADWSEGDETTITLWIQRMGMKVALNKVSTQNLLYGTYMEIIREIEQPVALRQLREVARVEEMIEAGRRFPWIRKNYVGPLFVHILMPASEAVFNRIALAEVEEGATYLSFGLKQYYQQHSKLPESLSQLVPDYISSIPKDPFDGELLRYSKERAIIYSVGDDFVDSQGSQLPFRHTLKEDEDYDDCAERDKAEPTFFLQFAQ